MSQFGGGTITSTHSAFLGGNFNTSGQVGGITSGPLATGAEVNFNVQGKAGLDASYTVNSGTVQASYNDTLYQNYAEPTQFNQEVDFTPKNTYVSYGSGSFSTTSPSVGAGVALDAHVSGGLGVTAAFLGHTVSGGIPSFSADLNQPLISYDTNGGLDIFGRSITAIVGTNGKITGVEYGGATSPSASFPVQIGETKLGVSVGPNQDGTGLSVGLSLSLGPSLKATKVVSIGASEKLGSLDLSAPHIALNSSMLQQDGVLTASASSTVASLNLSMGALLGALVGLGQPMVGGAIGALTGTDSVSLSLEEVGAVSLSVTPVSFNMGPDLSVAQTGTITPTNQLTYKFYSVDSNGQSTGNLMPVDVVKNGEDLGSVSSVTFTPGTDNIGVKFTGTRIYVQPSWNYGLNYSNKIELDAGLQGKLTVGAVKGSLSLGGKNKLNLGSVSLGPLYEKDFDFANAALAHIYDNTFSIYSGVTGIDSPPLPSFVIGSTFTPSLKVTTTSDSTLSVSGSLRYAVESANQLGASSSTPQVIHLGPGTYTLTIPPTGTDDASSGDLDITGKNVIIEGAGAGQTIIDAADLGDRIFDVNSGAKLTLDGVTLENGQADNGGAIYNDGTLNISNSALEGNIASLSGGALFNTGTLTISKSTLKGNSAGDGGAILNYGAPNETGSGTLIINDSALNHNTASIAGGAIYTNGTTNLSNDTLAHNIAGAVNNAAGDGGAISNARLLTVQNSVLSANSANFGGGISSSTGWSIDVYNSTLYDNTARYQAGGLYLDSPATLINDTITENRSNSDGGHSDSGGVGGGIYVLPLEAAKKPGQIKSLVSRICG